MRCSRRSRVSWDFAAPRGRDRSGCLKNRRAFDERSERTFTKAVREGRNRVCAADEAGQETERLAT